MYELKRAITNKDGETKRAGETVSDAWLGANADKLVSAGWVKPIKRKTVIKTDEPNNDKEADNG